MGKVFGDKGSIEDAVTFIRWETLTLLSTTGQAAASSRQLEKCDPHEQTYCTYHAYTHFTYTGDIHAHRRTVKVWFKPRKCYTRKETVVMPDDRVYSKKSTEIKVSYCRNWASCSRVILSSKRQLEQKNTESTETENWLQKPQDPLCVTCAGHQPEICLS